MAFFVSLDLSSAQISAVTLSWIPANNKFPIILAGRKPAAAQILSADLTSY